MLLGSKVETYETVCWSSAAIVVNNKGIRRLQRGNEPLEWSPAEWHGGWLTSSIDKIRNDVEETLRLDVEGSGRPLRQRQRRPSVPARKNRHGTWNVQGKLARDLVRLLAALDETIQWDAWSFQEVITIASEPRRSPSWTEVAQAAPHDRTRRPRQGHSRSPSRSVALGEVCATDDMHISLPFGVVASCNAGERGHERPGRRLPHAADRWGRHRAMRDDNEGVGRPPCRRERGNRLCIGAGANVELHEGWAQPHVVGRAPQRRGGGGGERERHRRLGGPAQEAARLFLDEAVNHRFYSPTSSRGPASAEVRQ